MGTTRLAMDSHVIPETAKVIIAKDTLKIPSGTRIVTLATQIASDETFEESGLMAGKGARTD
eukprot:8666562-Heterocapsa_arctica.AAC.1